MKKAIPYYYNRRYQTAWRFRVNTILLLDDLNMLLNSDQKVNTLLLPKVGYLSFKRKIYLNIIQLHNHNKAKYYDLVSYHFYRRYQTAQSIVS